MKDDDWQVVKEIGELVGTLSAQMLSLPAQQMATPAAAVTFRQPKHIGIPPQNEEFHGRKILLERISKAFDNNLRDMRSIRAITLHGLGGVGKSQLAREYAYRKEKRYTHIIQ